MSTFGSHPSRRAVTTSGHVVTSRAVPTLALLATARPIQAHGARLAALRALVARHAQAGARHVITRRRVIG